MLERVLDYFRATDIEYDEMYGEEYENEPDLSESKSVNKSINIKKSDNIITIPSNAKHKIELFKPRKLEDVRNIANAIRNEKTCIVSIIDTETDEDSQSIADYLTGAAYVLNGTITKLDINMFMVSPANTEISGSFIEAIKSKRAF